MKSKVIMIVCGLIILVSIVGAIVLVNSKNFNVPKEEKEINLGKTLVIYYSATNNTKKVAKEIASQLDGDLFEIEPVNKYTSEDLDYNNADSRVSKEHNDETLRNIELKSIDIKDYANYDTIFIGYPIWWGEAAFPVTSFVAKFDFQDKKVIPFATSASSSLGESASKLASLTKSGTWQEGKRFSSNASHDEIKTWLASLD